MSLIRALLDKHNRRMAEMERKRQSEEIVIRALLDKHNRRMAEMEGKRQREEIVERRQAVEATRTLAVWANIEARAIEGENGGVMEAAEPRRKATKAEVRLAQTPWRMDAAVNQMRRALDEQAELAGAGEPEAEDKEEE